MINQQKYMTQLAHAVDMAIEQLSEATEHYENVKTQYEKIDRLCQTLVILSESFYKSSQFTPGIEGAYQCECQIDGVIYFIDLVIILSSGYDDGYEVIANVRQMATGKIVFSAHFDYGKEEIPSAKPNKTDHVGSNIIEMPKSKLYISCEQILTPFTISLFHQAAFLFIRHLAKA